jgi:phosphocarrier protein FPr/phosphocarrier protein
MTASLETLVLRSPMAGWAMAIAETPDPVFAEKMLGDGIAIDPVVGELRAPCDGEVIAVYAAGHALTLRGVGGVEILLHIGLETVALAGLGFEARVTKGQSVAAGDLMIAFDLDVVAPKARSMVSPMVITNGERFAVVGALVDLEVDFGDPILTLRAAGPAQASAPDAAGETASLATRVGLPHGVHARPAALLAREAARFASEISLAVGDRSANARSPVAIMALGVRAGEDVTLTARGPDAAMAVEALAALLAQAGGEVAAQPASVVEVAPAPQGLPLSTLGGVTAAPGLAIGAAVRLAEPEIAVIETAGPAEAERAALIDALAAVSRALTARLATGVDESRAVAEAHLAFIEDPELAASAQGAIDGGASAGVAWRGAIGGYVDQLRALGDARMIERAADLLDLERQVLLELAGDALAPVVIPDNAILIADDLLPSQLMGLDHGRLAGVALSRGGPTSHVAIIAAALNIPAVVALGPRLLAIENGALLILDGDAGRLRVAPGPAELATAQGRLAERRAIRASAQSAAHDPCRMADGTRIEVFANLGAPAEAAAAVESGAEGCGLLRTEFLFLDRLRAPDEAEQLAAYQAIANALAGRPLIIRTLDVGGDKPVAYLPLPVEENPALGLRGIRVGLARPELLRAQLRAILRVRPAARIMAPMIASLAELRAVQAMAAELAAELGVAVPEVGVMVETPAAAVTADLIAAEADFLSVGSNDLAQYALAMDRGNPAFAAQFDGLHPAVLRLIGQAAAGGARHGRMVAVCGGLASDLDAAPILIGLGVTELSATPSVIPELKAAIRQMTMIQCRELATRALAQTSAAEVRSLAITGAAPPAARKDAAQ